MHRIEVNVQTGEQQIIELTPEEIAEIESRPQPEPIPEPTAAEKLAAAGLTVDELKELLGLPAPTEEDTVLVRARNEDGTYVADDPTTPENEAWTEPFA